MTRINLVHVKDLADQHLFAEWREIKMVPAALRRSLKTRNIDNILAGIPKRYTLNKGHVTFFFNKMQFLTERYKLLTAELISREYNINTEDDFRIFCGDLPAEFRHVEWHPDEQEIAVNVERILLRISEKPQWYRHYGNTESLSFFKEAYGVE
jgi:deoxyribonuclease (pyrimidine dimer)